MASIIVTENIAKLSHRVAVNGSFCLLSNIQGEWVWVKPATKDVYDLPFAAKILRTDKEKSLVLNDDGQEIWISNQQVSNLRWNAAGDNSG